MISKTPVSDLNTELPRDFRWPRPLYQCKFTCSTARISVIESVMWFPLSHHASTTSLPYQNSLLPDRSVHVHTGFQSYLEKSCPSQDHNTANTQNANKKLKLSKILTWHKTRGDTSWNVGWRWGILPKALTLFLIKICYCCYPIYHLVKKSRYPINDLFVALNISYEGLLLTLLLIMMKK